VLRNREEESVKRLWIVLAIVITFGFTVLGWVGSRIYQDMPPIPERIVTSDGQVVAPEGSVRRGQAVWQTLGGMEVGSIWGHGSYVAPDWTADWLHRECELILDDWARSEHARPYADLGAEPQAALRERLRLTLRANRYDPATGTLTLEPVRARAFEANQKHFAAVFSQGRPEYAIPRGTVSDPERLRQLSAFFFWTAWASAASRPGDTISYTSNWPHEPLIGNVPTGEAVMWTGVSILLLLGGIGFIVWFYAAMPAPPALEAAPARDPLVGLRATPSQRATMKYFVVVAALFLVQIVAGAVVAHYGVEGDGFYGIPLSRWLPYSLTRTWHVQLGLFWIATSWLAAGLFIGPLVGGVEPKGQRLGVNVLFGALVAVVVGSLAGQYLSIHGRLSDAAAFYWGHQGWEYLDLGRVWQSGLFLGLLIWLALMLRVIRPALAERGERRHLVLMFALSAGAIALFYGAGLMYGRQTHISMVEYWRWWVVHLWVEGFFEVFATTVIAFLFARLGLVSARLAAQASLLAATLYLAGGIVGTNHHLYFAGTPTAALAWGATLSALEVVPLVLIGYQAMKDLQISRRTEWARKYRWPIYFFIAVGFWNLVGAGLFGFMINPPIALFYMQGLNTTPVHAHAAFFGVYGMLGLGLTLMCLRALQADREWKEGLLRFSFWAMNGGLMAMIVLSLLPVGLLQTVASVTHGYWYSRSAEFLGQGLMQTLRWLRMPGDTLFAIGAIGFVVFVFGLGFGYSIEHKGRPRAGAPDRAA
jgi:nitric oxide reductase subunit B